MLSWVLGCHGPPPPADPLPTVKPVPFVVRAGVFALDVGSSAPPSGGPGAGGVTVTLTRVGSVPGAAEDRPAEPLGEDRYRVGDRVYDARTGETRPMPEPATFQEEGDHSVLRRFADDGSVRWSRELSGVRSVRRPDLVVGSGRVIVTIDQRVHAFDDATGAPVWTAADGEGFDLALAGDTVYAVDCNEPTGEHRVVGRAAADGAERFVFPLESGCDPSLRVDERHVLVGDHGTDVLARDGRPILHLPGAAVGDATGPGSPGFLLADGGVLVTEQEILRYDDRGAVRWRLPAPVNTFVAGAAFAEVPGGDLLIADYGAISDSGAEVMRVRLADGALVWRSVVAPAGVAHSQYEHLAYLAVRGERVAVVSQGSYAAFVESLDLATGVSTGRFTP